MFYTNHTFKYLFHKEVEQIPKDETINTVSSITEQDVIQREKISFEEEYKKAKEDVEKENCLHEPQEDDKYLELLETIRSKLSEVERSCEEENLIDLAISIGEKLAGIAIDKEYYSVIKNFIHKIAGEINQDISLTIKVNDGLVEELQKDLVNEKYSIMGNEKIKEGDCVLEWKNGKAENIWKNRKNEIENILLKCREV